MAGFTLAISCLTMFNLPWFVDLMFPGFYAILFFIASDFTVTSRHIHNWVSFLLWPSLFILSGAISLLFPGSILDPCWPGGSSSHVMSVCLSYSSLCLHVFITIGLLPSVGGDMNNATMHLGVQISPADPPLKSFIYIPRYGMVASCVITKILAFSAQWSWT